LQEIIADNPGKAGWSWGCVYSVDAEERTMWIADAHRDNGKRFVGRGEQKLTAFLELERLSARLFEMRQHNRNSKLDAANACIMQLSLRLRVFGATNRSRNDLDIHADFSAAAGF
jgi:hypothetical protein